MKKTTLILLLIVAARAGAQPTISSLSTLTGMPGSSVTITGTNFNATSANDVVYFGATRGIVTSASPTSLNVTVPSGAIYSPVTVENTATSLTGYSDYPFLPNYNNAGYLNDTINFDPRVVFASMDATFGILISDIDGDGKPDVVVAGTNILVYRNTSTSGSMTTGSFAAPVNLGVAQTSLMAIGDIDGDGKPDIAYNVGGMPDGGLVVVLRNNSSVGAISFDPGLSFATDTATNGLSIGDLDGDGKADIAAANFGAHNISVLRSISTPGTIDFQPAVSFATGSMPITVMMADIDGDGKKDLVTSNNGDNTISVLRNTTTPGTIDASSFSPQVTFATGGSPWAMAVGDIDGDGKTDVAVENTDDATISVLRNTAVSGAINAGSLTAAGVFPASGILEATISMGDINGDGKADFVFLNAAGHLSVLRNTSVPGAVSYGPIAAFGTSADPYTLAVGDLDGDGMPDIVVSDYYDSTISVLRNHPLTATTGVGSPGASGAAGVTLIPNPNNGTFNITGLTGANKDEEISLQIIDVVGAPVYTKKIMAVNGIISESVVLNSSLANGIYLLNVKSENANKVLHFVLEK